MTETQTQTFEHVADDTIRTYLLSDESTTLDAAGAMIDRADNALQVDAENDILDHGAFTARENAIREAELHLGLRDSIGVRRALRDFWGN